MSDVFYEVDEQLRSERLRTLAQKSWRYVLAALLVALGAAVAVWGWSVWRTNRSEHASDTYAQALEALSKGDSKTAESRLSEVAKSGPGAYRALALMQEAGLRVTEHKDDQAVSLLDEAAKASNAPVLADAAKLKAAMILMDTRPLIEIEGRLTPLAAQDRPYRWLARELLGLSRLQAGRIKEARGDFAVLSLAQDVSETSRNRARAAMALIDDGTAGGVPALLRAGLAAPTPSGSKGAQGSAASPIPPQTPDAAAVPAGAAQ